ncbi:MAG: branched-chain amino acid ABC transporter permease [Salinigranum sp.]
MNPQLLASLALNTAGAVLVLALVALGLGIIFGLMGVLNLAHGAFFTVGAYTVWFVATYLGLGFWAGLVVAPFVAGGVGVLAEQLVVRHLYDRLFDTLLATWGISIVITELVKVAFGQTTKRVANPIPGGIALGITTYPTYRIFLLAFSLATLLAVFAVFYRTNLGVRLRAVIKNEEAASLLGINQRRMYQLTFGVGTGVAGLAGAAVAPIALLSPNMGLSYLIQSFLAVILGGTGTLVGVVPGSLVVGGITNPMTYFVQPVVAQIAVFVLAIVLVVLRPQGLLGGQ